jgi:hypothetical protein
MDFKRIADRAKGIVQKRGGTESLKEDAAELKNIATGEGTLKDKAKATADAIKDPGAEKPAAEAETPGGERPQREKPHRERERQRKGQQRNAP